MITEEMLESRLERVSVLREPKLVLEELRKRGNLETAYELVRASTNFFGTLDNAFALGEMYDKIGKEINASSLRTAVLANWSNLDMDGEKIYDIIDNVMFKRLAKKYNASRENVDIKKIDTENNLIRAYDMKIDSETIFVNLNLVIGDETKCFDGNSKVKTYFRHNSILEFNLIDEKMDFIKRDRVYYRKTKLAKPLDLYVLTEKRLKDFGFRLIN